MKFMLNNKFNEIPVGPMNDVVLEMIHMMSKEHEKTATHVNLVAIAATEIARKMGYNEEDLIIVKEAAMLHDIGKLVPDIMNIVTLPRKLNDAEFTRIKDHAAEGAHMLESFGAPDMYVKVAAFHHERPDGRGYLGIDANTLPEIVRIVSVADAFTAMYERRIYANVMTDEQIIQEMIDCSGKQFDAHIVEQFVTHIYEQEEANTGVAI